MMVEEECEEDAPTFAHNGLWVPINICFDQIEGFTLHLREGINLWPVALLDNLPPDIWGPKKYFTLRNPRWIEQANKGVRRKAEGIEVERPKPKKKSSGSKFNDDADYSRSGTPSLNATLLISVKEHMKDAIYCANWRLLAIGTQFVLGTPPGWQFG